MGLQRQRKQRITMRHGRESLRKTHFNVGLRTFLVIQQFVWIKKLKFVAWRALSWHSLSWINDIGCLLSNMWPTQGLRKTGEYKNKTVFCCLGINLSKSIDWFLFTNSAPSLCLIPRLCAVLAFAFWNLISLSKWNHYKILIISQQRSMWNSIWSQIPRSWQNGALIQWLDRKNPLTSYEALQLMTI